MPNFPDVSLLITHYKRSRSLERLLAIFEEYQCDFGEIIISDDGSPKEHLDYINDRLKVKYNLKLITTPENKGLGNNMNKGQDAVTKNYTLYIQEDFEPQERFPEELENAVKNIETDPEIDMVRFFAHYRYPYLQPYQKDEKYSVSYLPAIATKYIKIYNYSDLPHLRRSGFLSKFGRYREGISGDKTEYWMCIAFMRKKGKSLFYNAFDSLFQHSNPPGEPSTMTRAKLTTSNNFFISILRNVYRQFKYNYDIFIRR